MFNSLPSLRRDVCLCKAFVTVLTDMSARILYGKPVRKQCSDSARGKNT